MIHTLKENKKSVKKLRHSLLVARKAAAARTGG
jgi:hypothetical protein